MNTSEPKNPPITMSKLYIGNLPSETNESGLRQLFLDQNLSCTNILVKRGGYAFVDCPDQSSADKAIDKLNGFNYQGATLVVEPSVASGKKRSSTGVLPDSPGDQVQGNGWSSWLKRRNKNWKSGVTVTQFQEFKGKKGIISGNI